MSVVSITDREIDIGISEFLQDLTESILVTETNSSIKRDGRLERSRRIIHDSCDILSLHALIEAIGAALEEMDVWNLDDVVKILLFLLCKNVIGCDSYGNLKNSKNRKYRKTNT